MKRQSLFPPAWLTVPHGLMRPALILSALLFMLPSSSQADTLNVPSPQYPTILAGITAAKNGDTVLVADGTYRGAGNRNLDFSGKNITVKSVNGPAKTIIDCQGRTAGTNVRGFYIHKKESLAIVDGFTITNGSEGIPSVGGAIYVSGSYATVSNCVFINNTAFSGGAVENDYGVLTITNCAFTNNPAYGDGGLGSSGTLTITGCTFNNNSSVSGAGGLGIENGGTATVTGCTFTSNTGNPLGGNPGAILVSSASNAMISNCAFTSNSGSGIGITGGGQAWVWNSTFVGNTVSKAGSSGAGMSVDSSGATVINCTFFGNTVNAGRGGAIWINSATSMTVMNCTFTGNSAPASSGGAIAVVGGGNKPNITNIILYGDSNEITFDSKSSAIVTYCDVQGGIAGKGNINADPKFTNAAGGDFHILASSPCAGAGTPAGAPPTDEGGVPRPNPPSIGAYEAIIRPKVTSFTPTSGPFGTKVTVTGANFGSATGVMFDTTPAPEFNILSATTITVSVPYGATSGPITVTNPAGNGTSAASFTVKTSPTLTVTSLTFSPTTIAPGGHSTGTVTLNSAAPTGGAKVNVSVGGFLFTTVTVPAGKTNAQFTATAYSYAQPGQYVFVASYNGGVATAILTIQ